MGYNKRYKRLNELTITDLAGNRCLDEILDLRDLLIQSIRLYLSRHLYYTDKDSPLECDIPFSHSYGCLKTETAVITRIWQDPVEGMILFYISNRVIELEDVSLEDQIYVLERLNHGY